MAVKVVSPELSRVAQGCFGAQVSSLAQACTCAWPQCSAARIPWIAWMLHHLLRRQTNLLALRIDHLQNSKKVQLDVRFTDAEEPSSLHQKDIHDWSVPLHVVRTSVRPRQTMQYVRFDTLLPCCLPERHGAARHPMLVLTWHATPSAGLS